MDRANDSANESGESTIDWRLGSCPDQRLETITLHYREWLEPVVAMVAAASDDPTDQSKQTACQSFEEVLASWRAAIAADPRGAQPLALNSYAIATRLITTLRQFAAVPSLADDAELDCLYRSVDWLAKRVEWDVRANHLLRDGVGLLWAAAVFEPANRRETSRWRSLGERIVSREVPRQLGLPDGLHYERSGHYHLEFVRDLLAVAAYQRTTGRTVLTPVEGSSPLVRAAAAIADVLHPDGLTHGFSDGQVESADDVIAAIARAAPTFSMRPPTQGLLKPSGFARLVAGEWTVFLNAGPPGPREQPGHTHADALAVEVSHRSRRVLVDPGTFHYDAGPRRCHDRSTAAHNTVFIDGRDSSEVWHIFRMGRRTRVTAEMLDDRSVSARRETVGQPRHRRRVQVDAASVLIDDRLVPGDGLSHRYSARFLLPHPWQGRLESDCVVLTCDGVTLVFEAELAEAGDDEATLSLTIEPAAWSPRYLVDEPATCVQWEVETSGPLAVLTRLRSE